MVWVWIPPANRLVVAARPAYRNRCRRLLSGPTLTRFKVSREKCNSAPSTDSEPAPGFFETLICGLVLQFASPYFFWRPHLKFVSMPRLIMRFITAIAIVLATALGSSLVGQ